MADECKTVRIGGTTYKIGSIMTSEAIVAYMRLVQLQTTAWTAITSGSNVVDAGMQAAKAFAFNFELRDIREGGDLYPLIACVTVARPSGDVPLTKVWEDEFKRRLHDLRALMEAVAEHNFGPFVGDFGATIVAGLEQALKAVAEAVANKPGATPTK